jgi:hypothetical protein
VRITISPDPLLILLVSALLISSSLDGAGDTVTLPLSAAGAGSDAIAGCKHNRKGMTSVAIDWGLKILFIMRLLTAIFAISFKKYSQIYFQMIHLSG